MKKVLFLFLLLAAAIAFAQPAPMPTPGGVVVPVPVVPLPDTVVALLVGVFASGASWYKIIDGVKNWIPGLKDSPKALKWLAVAGNAMTLGGGCFMVGKMNDAFDVAKCLVGIVMASLMSAGFYEAKKASDIARAGGAAPLTNAKAVAEVQAGTPVVPIPPAAKGSK